MERRQRQHLRVTLGDQPDRTRYGAASSHKGTERRRTRSGGAFRPFSLAFALALLASIASARETPAGHHLRARDDRRLRSWGATMRSGGMRRRGLSSSSSSSSSSSTTSGKSGKSKTSKSNNRSESSGDRWSGDGEWSDSSVVSSGDVALKNDSNHHAPETSPGPLPTPPPRPPRNDDDDDDERDDDGDAALPPPSPPVPPRNCVNLALYREIDASIAAIASSISNDVDRSHFFGGIVRLAAHDFMDHDANDDGDPMGADGCLDWSSPSNAGLSSIWNEHTDLYRLYRDGYSPYISRADFWIAAANGVIRQTSDGGLDLTDAFYWGREDRDECPGSAERLPTTESCREVEGVFLERMGLEWRDAVALLGAHTLGRGHKEFSGHHGTWVPNDKLAQVFDKRYYQELVGRSWSSRTTSSDPLKRDWTTGDPDDDRPKMMLPTDICLFYDVDDDGADCCTRTDLFRSDGMSHCPRDADRQCRVYGVDHSRRDALEAVMHYRGSPDDADNSADFYEAFRVAWTKATMNGMQDLQPLAESC